MMTTEEIDWDYITANNKNHILFDRQKHLLEAFLERNDSIRSGR